MSILPFIFVAAALLPYLSHGLRVEHLLVPLLVGVAVLRARFVTPESIFIIGGLLIGAISTAVLSHYSFETGRMAEPLSQFVRLVMPALIMIAFPTCLPQRDDASEVMSLAIVVCSALAALFLGVSLINSSAANFMMLWVSGGEGGTWLNSQDIGRYTGIFNQPIEAGVFYSIALIAAIHLFRYTTVSRLLLITCLVLIVIGGAASLSKNFVVLGAGLALMYAFWIRLVPRGWVIALSIPIIAVAPATLERINFAYLKSIKDLYDQDGLLAALSAGRFGSAEGSVSLLFDSLLSSKGWITGRGLGSHLPLDNGYLEYFYQGGIVALLGYMVALVALTWYAWTWRSHRNGKLLLVLMAYIWLASAGGPVITANRAGMVLLLLVSASMIGIRASGSMRWPRAE